MKRLSDLTWLEILHIMANTSGSYVNLKYIGNDYDCVCADICWREHGKPMRCGIDGVGHTSEEACEKLIRRIFFMYAKFPGRRGFKIPHIDFSSKEEFEMKMIIAGIDLQFMLGHRN